MKKLMLVVSLLFTINLSAAKHIGNVDVSTSGCVNYKWLHYNSYGGINKPKANICYDINQVIFNTIRWKGDVYDLGRWYTDRVQGTTNSTHYDMEGNEIYILVDVFGVPSDEPTVMYKYKTLNALYYQNIVNNGIVNGTRYWFLYQGDSDWGGVESGDIIVKKYATEKDRLQVK